MNPARSLAPALVSGHLESLWIYLAAPVVGALLLILHADGSKALSVVRRIRLRTETISGRR